jgi:hypothetical protein
MYTAHIGRRALARYNARHGTNHTPRTFFDVVFFSLFFDDPRYLMWVNNAPFDQISKQKRAGEPKERRDALARLHSGAEVLTEPLSHLVLGGKAADLDASTSGQVTDLILPASADEAYASWIGTACGIGVAGGLSLLIEHDAVLDALLDGWQVYRDWLRQTPDFQPSQMDSWNGWWLIHRFSDTYDEDDPTAGFLPSTKKGTGAYRLKLDTPPWSRVLFALAFGTQGARQIAYVYSLGNTNKTLGFLQIDLPEVYGLPALYRHLFAAQDALTAEEIATLWETEFGFERACQQGVLGTRSLEPKHLRKYMPTRRDAGTLPNAPHNESDHVTFRIYQTWIIAMLSNNEELLAFAEESANALHEAARPSGSKTTNQRQVDEVLKAGSRKPFVEAITAVVERDGTHAKALNRLVHAVMTMPATDVPLFLSLLRFKYAYLNTK